MVSQNELVNVIVGQIVVHANVPRAWARGYVRMWNRIAKVKARISAQLHSPVTVRRVRKV